MSYQKVDHPSKECEHCKEVFKPSRKDKRFCSDKCNKKSYNERRNLGNNKYVFKAYKKPYCEKCGFVPIVVAQLDVDHVDGDSKNNDFNNLRTLCANCHRLKTYAPGLF